jgi:hypothetical protein
MVLSWRRLTILLLLTPLSLLAQARFDLPGPKIDIRVTRSGVMLPVASVPNLQPGDQVWLHPDFPASQSAHYLLIVAFLRGTTNPPPDNWFLRVETWDKKVRDEGVTVTVPDEAQQAILFLAPETGGDFSTLRSAVKGRPGVFVRASQDLAEAGFEQGRIEKYLAAMKQVPPGDPKALQEHSDLLARTLNLKPNPDCFKRPLDQQYNCLTQTGTQMLLDDGHAESVVTALSNGPSSDFIGLCRRHRRPRSPHERPAHREIPVHPGDRVSFHRHLRSKVDQRIARPATQLSALVQQSQVGHRHRPAVGAEVGSAAAAPGRSEPYIVPAQP